MVGKDLGIHLLRWNANLKWYRLHVLQTCHLCMHGVKILLLLLCFLSMDLPPQRWLLQFSCCLQWAEPPSIPSCAEHAPPPEPPAWWCLQSPELPTGYLEREEIVTVTMANYYSSALVSVSVTHVQFLVSLMQGPYIYDRMTGCTT